jgi:hypothetical protein
MNFTSYLCAWLLGMALQKNAVALAESSAPSLMVKSETERWSLTPGTFFDAAPAIICATVLHGLL